LLLLLLLLLFLLKTTLVLKELTHSHSFCQLNYILSFGWTIII
jgi:hypothetical protein